MKTREQIIEDYFRARGARKKKRPARDTIWEETDIVWCWVLEGTILCDIQPKTSLADQVPIDRDFDLFREHAIDVMQAKGWYLTMTTYSSGAWWWKTEGITEGTDIHQGETVLLAAIEAATHVLEGDKE